MPVATETGVVANYNLICCVTIHFQRWKMLVCQKSNVSAYDKYLALRKSWLVMVNISDKDVYVGSNPTLVITTALFGGKFM